MSENTENHTFKLLQEMRKDMRDLRSEVRDGFMSVREEMRERFDDVNARINGVAHIMTLIAAHTGTLDERVNALEDSRAPD